MTRRRLATSIAAWALAMLVLAAVPASARAREGMDASASVVCSPEQLEFDDVPLSPVRAGVVGTVVVRNPAATPLLISGASISGADARDFAILDMPLQGLLESGATLTVRVRFAPRALGPRHASLRLSLSAARIPSLEIPLAGNGVPNAGERAPGPPLATLVSGPLLTTSLTPSTPEPWLPVNIRWAAGGGAGPVHYELQQSENGEPFEHVVLLGPEARESTRLLRVSLPGAPYRYRYRVRAITAAATGEWVTGREFSLLSVPLDDPSARWNGDWQSSGPGFLGEGVAHTRLSGRGSFATRARVESGLATSVAWVTRRGPDRGVASVLVDQHQELKSDLYAPGVGESVPVSIAGPCEPAAGHSITIRSLGRHHRAARGERVDVGGVVLLTELLDDADPGAAEPPLAAMTGADGLPDGAANGDPPPAAQAAGDPSTVDSGIYDPNGSRALRLSFTAVSPNPCAANTIVSFTTPRDGRARLHVLDISGRLLRTLVDGPLTAGAHSASWDGIDAQGAAVAPGIYFAVLRFENQALLARMVRR